MSKHARATAQAPKTPEGSPLPSRVFLRTYAGGVALPGVDEHAPEQRDKRLSLRDLQRWPELSIIPPLTQRTARSNEQGPATNAAPFLKSPAGQQTSAGKPSVAHDFSQVRIHATPAPTLQTKLAVNQPGDQYEQEADQVADNVLRMAAPGTAMAPATPNDDKPEDEALLRKERNGAGALSTQSAPPIVNEVLSGGGGRPLDSMPRSFMEQRFGHDFSRVRIHTGEQAEESAQAVNALAYTIGRDVVFERGQYAPETEAGRRLLAHELTHVVQQREAPALPASPEINPSAALTQPSWQTLPIQAGERVIVREQTDGQRVQREDQPAQQEKSWWDDIVDFAGDAIWSIVKEFAPELEPVLREILDKGIVEWLKGKISSVIDAFIDTLMTPVRAVKGTAEWLSTHFTELLTWMQEAAAKLAKGDCSAITETSEKIQQVVSSIVTPIVDRVKEVADKVGSFFTGLWDSFGAPIWDWLKKVGGAVWEKIQQLGSWIWEKTEPIRNKITKAWTWLKNKLGIGEGPEGQNGLLQWVQNKASEAWEWIKQKIEPIKKPLMIVAGVAGGIVVMLSPAGPFIAAGAAIGGLIAGIRWIRQHLNKPDGVVSNRDVLQKVIIPGIINSIHSFTGKLASAAGAITDKLNGIMAGLGQVIGTLSGSIINFAVKAVQWIADQFQNLVNWASDKLMALVDWVSRGLKRLVDFLQPVFDVLKQIGEVIFDILKLPFLILGKLWHMIPACIRDPFVNFLIEHMLKHIPILNKIMAVPNIWEKIQARAMDIIHKVFKDGDLTGAIVLIFKTILDVFGVPLELVTGIFEKAANAFDLIVNDPLGFLKNVLGALKQGFVNFFKNIATHLLTGVADWLFGELLEKGIHRPADLSFMSIFKFVMEILGLSIETIFKKLEEKIGPEKVKMLRSATRALGQAWDWVTDLLKDGPAGLWKRLTERLSNLWNVFLDGVIDWVTKNIITAMSEQLLSFLDPTGIMEIIQGIVDIYRMIKSAVKYMEKMLRIVNTILDTLVGIASGNLGPAAKMLEDAMDKGLPVVLGFLAGEVGLDDIGEHLKDIVETIREKVDEAIDWLIDTALKTGRAVLDALGLGGPAEPKEGAGSTGLPDTTVQENFELKNEGHTLTAKSEGGKLEIMMASELQGIFLVMLSKAITALEDDNSRPPEQRNQLLQILKKAQSDADTDKIRQDWINTEKQNIDFPQFLEMKIATLVNELKGLKDFGIKDLSDFYAAPPAKRYLPFSYRALGVVRSKLYIRGSEWSKNRTNVFRQGKMDIKDKMEEAQEQYNQSQMKRRDKWDKLVEDGKIPKDAKIDNFTRQNVDQVDYAVDHIDSLAEHWVKKEGNNTDDKERQAQSEITNLQLVTAQYNLEKGSGSDDTRFMDEPWVGLEFTSQLAQNNAKNAKVIEGEPFLDAAGNSLT